MKRNKRVAVTGGIGSGKSTFCALLRDMGCPVFSCDEINLRLRTDPSYLAKLKDAFPACVENGAFDFSELARQAFSDERTLARLNKLSHPLILEQLLRESAPFPLSFAEVPLLFEGGFDSFFDGIVVLTRDREVRVRHVMERSSLSREQVLQRMARQRNWEQIPQDPRILIVENNGSLACLKAKAEEALRSFGGLPNNGGN